MSGKNSVQLQSTRSLSIAGSSNIRKDVFEDDEVFNDSSFLSKFDNSAFQKSNIFESNINDSSFNNGLNISALCCDEEISGYDKLTGKTWIYPTNYSVRNYQFNIIKAALLKNTLVSLPTGLGKTFIAAVIMYNFYRWYPLGKIVFAAPTRPLVAQQIDACYNIVAIPPEHTIEMTGHMQVNTRKTHWQSKRVFFATPQVIYNDIKSGICPADLIRCLVIDEAHRARRNYAYCQIVATLDDMGIKNYRMLALSATPGSKVDDVVAVIKNLHIANLELRTEECIDVAQYSHMRKINTVIIKLGSQLTKLREQYVEILDEYARRLKHLNILPQNLGNLSKGRIVMLYKEFQTRDRGSRHPQHGFIMKDFTLLIVLFHGLELLIKHGARVFLNFFDEHPEKSWIQADERIMALLERLRDDLGINPLSLDRSIMPDGTMPEMPDNLCFGHPKFDKLKEIMLEHFTSAKKRGQDTRAIVFCEYRESVNLVHCLLLQCRPLITPQMFVGQGASGKEGKTIVSQKQQLRVMRSFREGVCNTLVATCVAEEGLDVGSVDLIICFDISTRSPVRLVQRCGRTGRERGGQVHILVTEGREHQTLLDCMRQRDGLNKKILQSKDVENSLYTMNPRLIPHDFEPQCQKMFITVKKKIETKKNDSEIAKKGQKDLRGMLSRMSSTSSNKEDRVKEFIKKDEFKAYFPTGFTETNLFLPPKEYWTMRSDDIKSRTQENSLKLYTWLEWQRQLQKTVNVGHSVNSEILVDVLQYSDRKRFEIASSIKTVSNSQDNMPTQTLVKSLTTIPKQVKKKKKSTTFKSPVKKDGDIRALFSSVTKSTKNYTKLLNDLSIKDDGSIPTSLINLIVDLNHETTNNVRKCYICLNVCDCTLVKNIRKHKTKSNVPPTFIKDLVLPDIELIDDINVSSIKECSKVNNFISPTFTEDDIFNTTSNFNLEVDFDALSDISDEDQNKDNTQKLNVSDKNFDIGDIEDIFVDSCPEEALEKQGGVEKEPKDALGFLGLESIDDIFADDDDVDEPKPCELAPTVPLAGNENNITENTKHDTVPNSEYPKSPSILSGKVKKLEPTSPILGNQFNRIHLSLKNKLNSSTPLNGVRENISANFADINKSETIKNKSKSTLIDSKLETTNDKSLCTITQLLNMINESDNTDSKATDDIEIFERSPSPILLTQLDRKKLNRGMKEANKSSLPKKSESLIILESDTDTDDTLEYDCNEDKEQMANKDAIDQINVKKHSRDELVDKINASPYFNKKQKLENGNQKQFTIQEKVLAAVKSNKFVSQNFQSDQTNFNFSITSPKLSSQKENYSPLFFKRKKLDVEEDNMKRNNLDVLKIFKCDSKIKSPKKVFENTMNSPIKNKKPNKRKIMFNDSDDDDFVDAKSWRSHKKARCNDESTTNHKKRKKIRKANSFLDLEAEISESDAGSGDELSEDSVGSIADFVCDHENITHNDIHAHYLKSIKSPMKVTGAFKIPDLPKRFDKAEVFSQYVEEDAYEMDSFCVDSHIGLTQANDLSELEVAEMMLENRRRRNKERTPSRDEGSPIRRKRKFNRLQIQSDSDDSS